MTAARAGLLRHAADLFDPPPNPYLTDPARWVAERLNGHLWSKQLEIFDALLEHRRVAVKSSHGVGKSHSAGRAVCWFIDTHKPGDAFAVTTAPTDPQVKAVLWREIARAHATGHLPGRITQDAQWKIDDELVAFGRKPADVAAGSSLETVTAFQGARGTYTLIAFDEAAGIPRPLWVAANSLMTGDEAKFLAIGNPDDPTSEFAKVCEGAPPEGGLSNRGWWVITISTFDTPNFTGEEVPPELRAALPGWTWLEEQAVDYGGPEMVAEVHRIAQGGTVDEHSLAWTSPLVMSKILGLFPEDASDGVVPWSWLRACRGVEATARIGELRIPVELGVDVGASDNGDRTVVRERQGMRAGRRWEIRSSDPEKVADLVVSAARESGASRLKVDSIGVGWGLIGMLRRELPAVPVVPVNVSEAADTAVTDEGGRRVLFVNRRAQIWWQVGRGLSKDRAWDLTDLDDRALADLAAPRWREDASGRIQIEEKSEIRKRLGRSPDDGDAVLLAFYEPPHVPGGGAQSYRLGGRGGR